MSNPLIDKICRKEFVLIAEIGVNYYDIAKKHNISNIDAAKLMIDQAKAAGIHAVKFQSYKAETIAAKDSPYYWDITQETTTSQYELFKKFDSFGKDEYIQLSKYCKDIGIEFLSTAFDEEAVDYLEDLMDIYKISSSDLSNLPFIEYQAKKKKPIIISCGASNLDEIKSAISLIKKYNDFPIVLMHCVLEYPTIYEHSNLNKITSLIKEFPDLIIGYSDHTKPDEHADVIKTAYLLGATVIEKHFTLDKNLIGNDHYHAMDPKDAKVIIEGIEFLNIIKGSGEIKSLDSESTARLNARRSIVSKKKILAGEIITKEMLTHKRPGTGISPDKIDEVIGKIAINDIEEDTIINNSHFK